jgi:hypothetical protein
MYVFWISMCYESSFARFKPYVPSIIVKGDGVPLFTELPRDDLGNWAPGISSSRKFGRWENAPGYRMVQTQGRRDHAPGRT